MSDCQQLISPKPILAGQSTNGSGFIHPLPLTPSPAPASRRGRTYNAGEGEECSKGWGEQSSSHPFEKPSSPLSACAPAEDDLTVAERGVRGERVTAVLDDYAPHPTKGPTRENGLASVMLPVDPK
jgi:hypothetical protein